MKVLDINQMELIEAGGFWDGFCAGYGVALTASAWITLVPGANAAAVIVGVGCIAYLATQ